MRLCLPDSLPPQRRRHNSGIYLVDVEVGGMYRLRQICSLFSLNTHLGASPNRHVRLRLCRAYVRGAQLTEGTSPIPHRNNAEISPNLFVFSHILWRKAQLNHQKMLQKGTHEVAKDKNNKSNNTARTIQLAADAIWYL